MEEPASTSRSSTNPEIPDAPNDRQWGSKAYPAGPDARSIDEAGSLEAAHAYRVAGAPRLNDVPLSPLPYHRLWRADPFHGWWKPLVEFCISGPLYFVLALVISIPMFLLPFVSGSEPLTLGPNGYPEGMFSHPVLFLFMFLSIAVMAPCVLLARLIMGPKPLGLLFSVAGKLRWKWLATCLGLGLALFVIFQGLSVWVSAASGAEPVSASFDPATGWWILAIILIVVPLQCAAEEMAFRGFLMQAVGRWLKHPIWAVILPAPFFVLSHGYGLWGLLSVGILAVIAGILCIATGGLEASIGLHVSNNVTTVLLGLFGFADPFGAVDPGPMDALVTLVVDGLYAVLVLWASRRRHLTTRRNPATSWPAWPAWALHNAGARIPEASTHMIPRRTA
ncbi:CPBP family intramembrane glutamic endopeptidase [Rothia uropygialis]|uniref:CPBP family intramembrane glutamic endopeptidase n=1 Tax=Kocuria sp. 36 TaxID=1415402 RepID=UPI0013EBE9ED|nr:CPBP family intramembrane glutamic endopeptidase [Kocuria sp. 36]